jgi:hypothetical protein
VGVKAVLRIAYSNQKFQVNSGILRKLDNITQSEVKFWKNISNIKFTSKNTQVIK